ncbi:ABC transporter permease [Actinoplanes sp. NEAU-A12]|uniref:Transport permease protein n=1 Tax=Actinoplanes sandaracinus TaxID=3045177 RepID=A0ABT6WHP2_9ACTN|nr:ABC transporter permease [Actinoplanes sandaracinus]MDI6099255.1 ABC transporter permease [Actinoplanes sandaracinus]
MIALAVQTTALTNRHLRHLTRMPMRLLGVTVMPIAYVVIFGYLFGSVIEVEGGGYREFLMAGIFAQMMLTNLQHTALGVVDDLRNGIDDRFRSLPVAGFAVPLARTVADLTRVVCACVAMAVVGYAMGWRVHNGLTSALAGFGLLLLLGFASAWVGVLVGLKLRNAESVSAVSFLVVMPATFLSNAFIPLTGLPAWLRTVCEWNPLSVVVAACRQLFGNPGSAGDSWPMQHPVPAAVGLTLALLAIAAVLATRAYRAK